MPKKLRGRHLTGIVLSLSYPPFVSAGRVSLITAHESRKIPSSDRLRSSNQDLDAQTKLARRGHHSNDLINFELWNEMPNLHEFWDPNEWELHVFGLLQDRHGPLNVNKVPARHKGDVGLDYYSLAYRVAYQCYAVQEPCEVADRAEKQKAKMTTDLRTFCTKMVELQAIFGSVQVSRWVLTVPLHDSRQLNAHATKKTNEIKSLRLPYVADDFEVMVQDIDSFDAASRTARALQRRSVSIPSLPVSPQDIEDWSDASNALVHALTRKLRKRVAADDPSQLEDLVTEAVGWFLERENALDNLRSNAPQLYEALFGVISRRTERLRFLGAPAEGSAHQILRDEIEDLIADLQTSVENFSLSSAHQIALGTVAEWLMRCHLDFPPYDHAGTRP